MGESEREKIDNAKESVRLAHEAIKLDLTDSFSWCKDQNLFTFLDVLGNAHFTNFFVTYESYEELNKSLKAYHQAVTQLLSSNLINLLGRT